jgi:hypothetical protein
LSAVREFRSSPGVGADVTTSVILYGDLGISPDFSMNTEQQTAAPETQKNIINDVHEDPLISLVVHSKIRAGGDE